jgi:hypothetical protein
LPAEVDDGTETVSVEVEEVEVDDRTMLDRLSADERPEDELAVRTTVPVKP